MGASQEDPPLPEATRAWMAHYAAVSKNRPRRVRLRRRRVLILGHKFEVRSLVIGAAVSLVAGAALVAAILAAS